MTKEQQIEHSFLRTKLPGEAKKRSLHTLIIVLGENDKTENEQMMALQKRLDDVISKKIREKKCDKTFQKTLTVKPKTCPNIKKIKKNKTEEVQLSNYFFCTVKMDELNVVKLYLLNFNPMDDTDTCEYSKNGSFTLGAGVIKGEKKTKKNNEWFIVNHLHSTELTGIKMNCNKK